MNKPLDLAHVISPEAHAMPIAAVTQTALTRF